MKNGRQRGTEGKSRRRGGGTGGSLVPAWLEFPDLCLELLDALGRRQALGMCLRVLDGLRTFAPTSRWARLALSLRRSFRAEAFPRPGWREEVGRQFVLPM